MDIFLCTNFFPYKHAEPFLANEFGFTKQYAKKITVLTLYGIPSEQKIPGDAQVTFLPPLLERLDNKRAIFLKGVFNTSGFSAHLKEFFQQRIFLSAKKFRWFTTSLLITRHALSSAAFKALEKQVERSPEPVVYFYWGDNLSWLIPYIRQRFHNKKLKIVIRLHGTDLYENLRDNYAPLREQIFSAVDRILPVSENGRNYLSKKYPAFESKLLLSRLGVFDNGPNPYESAREPYVVVSVSNLIPLKRVHLIFESLQKAKAPVIWHHFGDGPLAAELRALVDKRREGLRIVFHGQVNNADLIAFYKNQSVNLFMNLSTSEGLPVSIMEALSFGIPVIATHVGGTSELVNETVGRLIPSEINTSELAQTIDELLSEEPAEMGALRKNARRVFEEKVWADKNYSELYMVLGGIVRTH